MTSLAPDAGRAAETIDGLQAGLFWLMTSYAAAPSSRAAAAVVEQLMALCRHPHIAFLPIQAEVYVRLLNEWRARLPWEDGPQAAASRG
jgi:hypothetical protein